jgi:GNAT superfamily N-acetyltransferase
VLIAELEAQTAAPTPVGFMCVERQPESPWGVLLDNLHALPAHQGIGVGKRLMEAAQSWAREQGEAQLYLYVLDGNTPAIAFYERQGWQFSGSEPDRMGGVDITALRYVYRLAAG